MDAIDQFDVEIDIEDRERLYDYVTCTLLKRPETGKWDPDMFKGLGTRDCVPEDDEHAAHRVLLMDRSIHDKGYWEKKMKDDSKKDSKDAKEEDELADEREDRALPRRVMPVYKPGEIIKGNIVLKLNQPIDAECLSLNFLGQAFVNIRIYHRYGYYDAHKEEVWVDETKILWQKADHKSDVSDSFALLATSDGAARSGNLPRGEHSFPFCFLIPETARQSTPPLLQSNDHRAFVVYRLRAKIDKGKALSAGNINAHKAIWLETPYDTAEDLRNLEPASTEESLSTGVAWKPGKISVCASLPRTGVLIGEPVHLTLEVNNHSGGSITKLEACVRMTGKAQLGRKKLSLKKNITIKSQKCRAENIGSGMCPLYKWDIPWDFTDSGVDGNLLPVGTLNDCDLIDVQYDVRVKATRKGRRRNLDLHFPIIVGNFCSNEERAFDTADPSAERVFYTE